MCQDRELDVKHSSQVLSISVQKSLRLWTTRSLQSSKQEQESKHFKYFKRYLNNYFQLLINQIDEKYLGFPRRISSRCWKILS